MDETQASHIEKDARRQASVLFPRVWAMPNHETFDIPPIKTFVNKYLAASTISIDPFTRNKCLATYTNDLNPDTKAEYHLEAFDFLSLLQTRNVKADLILFDPPYSIGQMRQVYQNVGRHFGIGESQNWRTVD